MCIKDSCRSTDVSKRKRRSDAVRSVKPTVGVALHKPVRERAVKMVAEAIAGYARAEKIELDDIRVVEDESADDPEWAPPPEHDVTQRLTTTASTLRQVFHSPRVVLTTAWTSVRPALRGPRNTKAVMDNQTADEYATQHGADIAAGREFEWCHMIADCLGGATKKENLFCGGKHANTHMEVIEHHLMGRTEFEVSVEVQARENTCFAEYLIYRVRSGAGQTEWSATIDSLSAGFSREDKQKVDTELGLWIRMRKQAKRQFNRSVNRQLRAIAVGSRK